MGKFYHYFTNHKLSCYPMPYGLIFVLNLLRVCHSGRLHVPKRYLRYLQGCFAGKLLHLLMKEYIFLYYLAISSSIHTLLWIGQLNQANLNRRFNHSST